MACPLSIAKLLLARGIASAADARIFFAPTTADLHDPSLLLGMDVAVERIASAVSASEKILIYGDYDVDGTVAIVLLKTAIERMGTPACPASVVYHVPHRIREGYGMQNGVLATAAAEGVRLVISVDTGIRAFEQAEEAARLNLDLIVTDHHLPDGVAGMPRAVAVINPAQPGCTYPNKNLCGAAVAFKLAHALLRASAKNDRERERLESVLVPSLLKLVAIATIADSVSLTGENRTIVMLGLGGLSHPRQPGLRALMHVAQIEYERSPTAREVGFQLAPRINAAGRMDVASDVVELFLTRDDARATELAQKLDALNQDRRATEAAALDAIELQLLSLRDATGQLAPECLILGHPEWHRGVLGILASRVVERTGRPALVLCEADQHSEGDAHGSGRSIPGFHLLDALTAVHAGDLFHRFGGHAHAVGFSLPRARLTHLRERMQAHSRDAFDPGLLIPELFFDATLDPHEIGSELTRWIERFSPFGMGHDEPVFAARGLAVAGPIRVIKERHVCIPLAAAGPEHDSAQPAKNQTWNSMGWTRNSHSAEATWAARCTALELRAGSRVDVLFHLRQNTKRGFEGIELVLIDLQPALEHTASV